MYIRLRVKNWRSIDDATIELAPFTVIVGRNSGGKSNLVDALLFGSEIARDAEGAVQRRGGIGAIRRWGPGQPRRIIIATRVAAERGQLDSSYVEHELVIDSVSVGAWRFARERIASVFEGKRGFLMERDGSVVSFGDADGIAPTTLMKPADTASVMAHLGRLPIASHASIPVVRAIRPALDQMRQPQPAADSSRLSPSAANIAWVISELNETRRGEVVAAMRNVVPGLVDLQAPLVGGFLFLSFEQLQADGRKATFNGLEMSDGALQVLAIVVAAQQVEDGEVLVIEEPEVNLHPGAADVIYDALHGASTRGNVVITTHSPELLDRAKDDEILVCEYVDGVTKIGPLSSAQRALVREGLFSVGEIMRSEDLRREGAAPRVVED